MNLNLLIACCSCSFVLEQHRTVSIYSIIAKSKKGYHTQHIGETSQRFGVDEICPPQLLSLIYDSADITLRQIASQLSGLPRAVPCGITMSENVCPKSTKDILKSLSSQMLIHPPWGQNLYTGIISMCIILFALFLYIIESHMYLN